MLDFRSRGCFSAFVALTAVMTVAAWSSQAAGQSAPVAIARVKQEQLKAGRTLIGTVMPLRRSVVGSAVDGRVVEVPVEEGDFVRQGDPLAKLLTKTIEIEIKAARANLRLREEEWKEQKAGARKEEKEQALARYKGAEALRDYARARFQRTRNLFRREGLSSKEDYDEAQSAAMSAEKTLLAERKAYELILAGPRQEQISQAHARYQEQQAEVERLEDRLAKYTIRARFDGYITKKLAEVGEWITSSDDVAELIDLDPVEIEVAVPEEYVSPLRADSQSKNVVVEIEALPTQRFTGHIAAIVPQADLRTRTFPVKIRVDNPLVDGGRPLKAGMLAHVTLPVGRGRLTVMVPKDALVLGKGPPSVYLVVAASKPQSKLDEEIAGLLEQWERLRSGDDDAKAALLEKLAKLNSKAAVPTPVRLGVADGSWIEVIGEVTPGRYVVVRGNERLRPEQELTLLPNR